MHKNNKWLSSLQRINVSVMILLAFLAVSSIFITYSENWRYLPTFKYHILDSDKLIEIFVHTYIFNFNMGFYFQLFVLIFSFMIFFSTKRNISFHMMYILVILRSTLILMQSTTLPAHYIAKSGDNSIVKVQISYIIFFGLLFILNMIFDTKKRPRKTEPYDIIKD